MSDAQRRAALTSLGFKDKTVSAVASLIGSSDAIRRNEAALRDHAGTTKMWPLEAA